MRVVIVGAGLAGIRCAEALRERGFDGQIVLVGDENHSPYTRPPLSKQVLAGTREEDRVQLRSAEEIAGLELDLRTGTAVVALDVESREVRLADGSTLPFDGLVISTGARARSLPAFEGRPGVYTLRTLDDSRALRAALDEAVSVVVVGGGFIGAEVAATAHGAGKKVTIVEPQEAMLVRGLGTELGGAIEALHRANDVDVRSGTSVEDVNDDGSITTLTLSDGAELAGDVIVLGVGAIPNVEWLEGSGLGLDNGVRCDEFCRVLDDSGAPVSGIVAAGDVARWKSLSQDDNVRVEHWTNAQEQAAAAARTLAFDLGATNESPGAFDPTPYVWSDQFGKKIQVVGYVQGTDTAHVVKGDIDSGSFLALMERDGVLVGAVAVAMVPALVKARMLVDSSAALSDALEALAE